MRVPFPPVKQMISVASFSETADYLPILNGVLLTDIIVIGLLLAGWIQSRVLQAWYKEFSLGAVIADVLIIIVGIILARFFYPLLFSEYSLTKFIGLAVGIQILHDITFYAFAQAVPRGKSRVLDVFKNYGQEVGYKAIVSDSLMMISSICLATFFKGQSLNLNIITLIASVYLVPYLVYSV